MKIAVIGATGFVGSALVDLAVKQNHHVYAISRHKKYDDNKNITSVISDIKSIESIKESIKDSDIIISAFNAGWDNPNLYNDFMEGSRKTLELAKSLDKRIIIVGGASSLINLETGKPMYDTMPENFKKIVKGAFDLYQELQDNKEVKWTFVSPALDLNHSEAKLSYNVGGDYVLYNSQNESKISVHDLADLLIKEAVYGQSIHKRITLADY